MNKIINGREILELTWQPRETVTSNKRVQFRCLGCIMQNMGETTVLLSNGWTILPRGTFQLAASTDINILVVNVKVQFSGSGTNKLEISELTTNHPELANYIEQGR